MSPTTVGLFFYLDVAISMDEIAFLEWGELQQLHAAQLERFGGQDGFIDEGVVRSAFARAQFAAQYNPDADLADLAAEYFYGMATTQGYCDGNKRTALNAAAVFIRKNNWRLTITNELMYVIAMAVVTGTLEKEALARILRDHMEEIEAT